jgi:hypothetical protein
MEVILSGLRNNVDVSVYANPCLSHKHMKTILRCLLFDRTLKIAYNSRLINENRMDLSGFDGEQVAEIWLGLEAGLDISLYAKPEFDANQMKEIRLGLLHGVDASQYADPSIHWADMRTIRVGLTRPK